MSAEDITPEKRRFVRGSEMPDREKNPRESQRDNGAALIKRPSKSFAPSESLLRRAKQFQEKLRGNKKSSIESTGKGEKKRSKSKSKKTNLQSKSNDGSTSSSTQKGKSYKTRSDQKQTEPSRRRYFLENYIYDTKIGARNSRTEFMFRRDRRLGSHSGRLRPDRIYSVEDRHEEGERAEFSPGYSLP